MPYLSALEVCARQGAIQIHIYHYKKPHFKLKLKTNLYKAIKSEDSEALDGGTSQLRSQKEYSEIKMFWGSF